MKGLTVLASLAITGIATASPEIKRLSPVIVASRIPAQCRIVSIFKDTPAEKAGIVAGDVIQSVNGKAPSDASGLSDIVNSAPQDTEIAVGKMDGAVQHLRIHLNATRPRLGAVCDLTGWIKAGVTAAGNESITLFNGPCALTASGIIDKGLLFVRVRVTNNFDHPVIIGPELFHVSHSSGIALTLHSPEEVMCILYGDKGVHLLALKKKRKDTLDSPQPMPGTVSGSEYHCASGNSQGRLKNADTQYAEANAQYMATESLWPATYKPGDVADGLIYFDEPPTLPVTLTATIETSPFTAQLGLPQASDQAMKHSDLVRFFTDQKKGNSLKLTLKKGKVFVGKFSSYDEDGERVWFSTPSGGVLNTTSYSIEAIRSAESLEQIPAKPGPASDHLN